MKNVGPPFMIVIRVDITDPAFPMVDHLSIGFENRSHVKFIPYAIASPDEDSNGITIGKGLAGVLRMLPVLTGFKLVAENCPRACLRPP